MHSPVLGTRQRLRLKETESGCTVTMIIIVKITSG